jgi:aminoglycoside phosphotransferase (APT) family kinase protein
MSRRGEILRIDGHDVEAYCFPNDRRLRGLRTFARRDLTLEAWRRWSPLDAQIDEDSLQRILVRFVPEQKCVVRLRAEWKRADGTTETRRIAVRCGSTSACESLEHRHRRVAAHFDGSNLGIAVPRVVGCDAQRGLLAVEWLRGESLIEKLRNGNESEVMAVAANALRQFHAVPAPNLTEHTNEDLIDSTRDALSDLAARCPDLDHLISQLQGEWPDRLSKSAPGPIVTLHNDLHPDQMTFKRNRVAILDLERMATGSADIDVANMATQIEMLGCRPDRDVDSATAAGWRRAFLSGWRETTQHPLDPVRFHLLAARTRLVLARGMMRHLRPWWTAFAVECVTRAAADLQRAMASEEVP